MIAQIERLDELDLGKAGRGHIGLGIDALHQNAGEQEIREDDNATKAEPGGAVERRVDSGMGDAAERRFGPAEPHPLPQHAGDLGDVGIGVGVIGTAPDDDKHGVLAALRHRSGDALGRRGQQLRVDRKIAAEPHVDAPMFGHEAVHFPRQVVLDMARREQHARHRQDLASAARHQLRQTLLDRRASEFEIAGGEIMLQARAQRSGGHLELGDRLGIAAAMAAQQHRGLAHPLTPCWLLAAMASSKFAAR